MNKTLTAILVSLRPHQWIKNAALLVALVFSRNVLVPAKLLTALAAVAIFCLLSGGTYLFNDLADREGDRRHPRKCKRPVAAGELSPGWARVLSAGTVTLAVLFALLLNRAFGLAALAYLVLQIAYSLRLKHVVILDIFCIATSFFIRVMAGALAIDVAVSSWLLVCTFFISLFIALGKRRHEILLLEGEAGEHRAVLDTYDILLLDQMISVVTSATLVAYTVYTLSPVTVERFGSDRLKYTIPFVLYGIYRYLYLVYRRREGGAPELMLWQDLPMLVNLVGYTAVLGAVLYGG
jgi:4-hydroxybenzoate polyprenyltransferase